MYLTLRTIMNYSAGPVTFSGQSASLNHIIPVTEKLREILAIAIYRQTVLRGGAQKRQAHCILKGTGLTMPASVGSLGYYTNVISQRRRFLKHYGS